MILYKIPSNFAWIDFTVCLYMKCQNLSIFPEESDLINLHNIVKDMRKYTTFLKSEMKK